MVRENRWSSRRSHIGRYSKRPKENMSFQRVTTRPTSSQTGLNRSRPETRGIMRPPQGRDGRAGGRQEEAWARRTCVFRQVALDLRAWRSHQLDKGAWSRKRGKFLVLRIARTPKRRRSYGRDTGDTNWIAGPMAT